jgi:hypothetical protein
MQNTCIPLAPLLVVVRDEEQGVLFLWGLVIRFVWGKLVVKEFEK